MKQATYTETLQYELQFIDDYEYWDKQPQYTLPNYNGYIIYPKQGLIYSTKTNRFIGSKHPKGGYLHCSLTADDGTVTTTTIHRVIWTAVNGEIPQDMEINHKDEDNHNNKISNLELVTRKENINFGTRNERVAKALSKQVGAFKDGVLVMTFPSTMEAGRQGYNQGNVAACCNGCFNRQGNNTYKGFQWRYIN